MSEKLRVEFFEASLQGTVKELRLTGEYRSPKKNEWYVDLDDDAHDTGEVQRAAFDFDHDGEDEPYHIVEVIYEN